MTQTSASGELARQPEVLDWIFAEASPSGLVVAHDERTQKIAEQLLAIRDYGDPIVTTRMPDIPGAEYKDPLPGDEDQRPYTTLAWFQMKISGNGPSDFTVSVSADRKAGSVALPLDQIQSVHVDHPFGRDMPLHGSLVPAAVKGDQGRVPVLRWASRFIEFGYWHRLETAIHPNHRQVGIIRAYQANAFDYDDAPNLEEVRASGERPQVYLVSRIEQSCYAERHAIITSRLGHTVTSPVIIRPPKDYKDVPHREVDMLDMADNTPDQELLDVHLDRLRELDGRAGRALRPIEADAIYLYATLD